jgi:hypothetical protein
VRVGQHLIKWLDCLRGTVIRPSLGRGFRWRKTTWTEVSALITRSNLYAKDSLLPQVAQRKPPCHCPTRFEREGFVNEGRLQPAPVTGKE